jgi:hypothetical protein
VETPLFRLADVGSADPCRLLYDLFDMLLRPLLYRLELANNSFQPLATYLLVLAQVLGIAIRRNISSMVSRYDSRYTMGTCLSRLEPYCNGHSMDSHYASSNKYENNAPMAHIT